MGVVAVDKILRPVSITNFPLYGKEEMSFKKL